MEQNAVNNVIEKFGGGKRRAYRQDEDDRPQWIRPEQDGGVREVHRPIVFEKLRDPIFLAEAKERSKLYDMPLDPSKAPMKGRKAINILKSQVDYSDALAKAIKEYFEEKNPGVTVDEDLCKRLLTHYAFEGLLKLSELEDET